MHILWYKESLAIGWTAKHTPPFLSFCSNKLVEVDCSLVCGKIKCGVGSGSMK